jgi:class 3 adenylate cyclase
LSDAAQANGGRDVRWLGDGLMVAFSSVSDALQCAVAVQQAARWPVDGVRLAVRVGLDVGETLRENRDHFGTTVVVARRLCDRAESGEILCSALFADLLGRGRTLRFAPRGKLIIDGVPAGVDACEVLYQDRRARNASESAATRKSRAPAATLRNGHGTRRLADEPSPRVSARARGGTRSERLSERVSAWLRWIKIRSLC